MKRIAIQFLLVNFILQILCALTTNAQNVDYAWTITGGAQGIDDGRGVTTDVLKNVYSAGTFSGTVDFDPGVGVNSLTATGSASGYLAKYDVNGDHQWVIQISGTVSASAISVCSDTLDNIYIIGDIAGVSGDFDPGVGVSTITSIGQTDIYIAKYTSVGQFVWLLQFGGTLNDYARKIKAGRNDELVVTCNFEGAVDFDPGLGTNYITSAGLADVFIARIRTNGELDWVKTIGNSNGNLGPGIGVDKYGSVYSAGGFGGTLDTDPDSVTTNFLTALGNASDGVIIKLDSNGVFQWSHKLSSNSVALINDVEPDDNGNLYLTGWFSGFVDFNPTTGLDTMTNISGIDVFIWKLTDSGNHTWVKRTGNSFQDFYDGRSVKIDENDNPYVLGIFEGTADFDPGTGTNNMSSSGDFDIFVWGLHSNSSFLFSNSIGGSGKEVSADLHLDVDNNIYFTGFFTSQVDFNPWVGSNIISPASTVADFHINKWNNCITNSSTLTQITCDTFFTLNGQTYTSSGTYTQTLVNAGGCDSILTIQLAVTSIDTAISITGSTLTSLQSGASYRWYSCGGTWLPINNATQQSFTPSQNGLYVLVITLNGCTDTSRCVSIVGLGAVHFVGNNFCNIYPNPSSGIVYFDWNKNGFKATIYFYNSLGQLLEAVETNGQSQTKIHFNKPKGFYVLKIKAQESEMIVPLVIE